MADESKNSVKTNYGPPHYRTFSTISFAREMAQAADVKQKNLLAIGDDSPLVRAMAPFMEMRYRAVDAILARNPTRQYLETCAGWTTRPLNLALANPDMNVVETDYSADVISIKPGLITSFSSLPINLKFGTFDMVTGDGLETLLPLLSQETETNIAFEGLLLYTSHDRVRQVAKTGRKLLSYFPKGSRLITPDVITKPNMAAVDELIGGSSVTMQKLSHAVKQDVTQNFFENDMDAMRIWQEEGFEVKFHHWGNLVQHLDSIDRLKLDRERVYSLIGPRGIFVMSLA